MHVGPTLTRGGCPGARGGHRGRIAGLLLFSLAGAAWAPSAEASKNVTVSLVSEQASVQPGRPFYVGLQMKMRPGWHTYWKNPGDSGLPPKITWNLPEGFSAGPIVWPAPERIAAGALMSYGYAKEVLLPVEIIPPERIGADSVTLACKFDWLECADVCLPASSEVGVTLPVRTGTPVPGPVARSFAATRGRIPAAPTGWTFVAEAGPRAISLEFHAPPGKSPREAYLFVDRPLVADYAAPQGLERLGDHYRLTVLPAANAQKPLERLTGVLVLEGRLGSTARTAVRVDVPVKIGDPAPAAAQSPGSRPRVGWDIVVAVVAGLGVATLLARSKRRGGKSASPRPEPNG